MGEATPLVRTVRRDGVLEVILDHPPVNALSHALRAGIEAAIAQAEADADVRAVVIRAEGRTFPAGADIAEFGKPPKAPLLTDVCNRIEACSKPVVAALHGTALGGGFELALAAHGRIALASARVGLPEVALGILPGAGGTQRVPRLIGAEQALRMMLGGKPVGAVEALAMGLLDRVVEDGLAAAAHDFALELPGRGVVPTRDRRDGMRDGVTYQAAVAAARARVRDARLPGPARIVDCVEAAQLLPFDQGLAYERAAFTDLVATPEAAGLRHAFFAERAAGRMPESRVAARALHRIGVMGAAGSDLVVPLLLAGFGVVLVDGNRPALVAGLERIAAAQEQMVVAGSLTEAARDADWARLSPSMAAAAFAEVDLVLIADAAAAAEVAEATAPGVALVLTGRGAGLEGPRAADMLGLRLMPGSGKLAEVIVGPPTAPEAVAAVLALVKRLGRTAVRSAAPGGVGGRVAVAARAAMAHLAANGHDAGDVAAALAGFGMEALAGVSGAVAGKPRDAGVIVNRVLAAMANEGARLLGRGMALRPSDIDLALVGAFGFPRWEGGPMHWADRRGLLVLRRDLREWAVDALDLWTPAPLLDDLISKGQVFGDFNRV